MSDRSSSSVQIGSWIAAIVLFVFGGIFASTGFKLLASLLREESGTPNFIGGLVGGVFLLFGVGAIVGGIRVIAAARQGSRLARKYPDQPWMHNKTWASGRIKDSNLVGALFMIPFALFWNGVSWTVILVMLSSGNLGENPALLIFLLFPLIGLGLAWAAVYQILRWRKYGTSVFELAEIPGVIGGNLGGLILTRVHVRHQGGFTLTLRNVHQWTSGSGKNRRTHTETLWESRQVLDQEAMPDDPTRSALPVLFFIPYTCHPTQRRRDGSQDYWELTATARAPGLDYKASFRVPVFHTKDSDPNAQQPSATTSATGGTGGSATPLPELGAIAGLTVRPDLSGAEVLEFKPMRHLALLFFPLLIGGGMVAFAYFAWNSGMPKLFPVVFLLFGLFVCYGVGSSLLSYVRVYRYPDRLEVRSRRFGMKKTSTLPRKTITRIEVKQAMSSGNSVFYNALIHTADGQTVTVPTLIRGRREAEAFAAHLEKPMLVR
ncbi:hypothetical protein H5P28_01920 [Ruficoccus amylovorans]|uniref:Uncharacterized protein n=1 Tax=Ruficoccus amylovorans TaxID=1804625 RepID=A0A842HA87_9BACT|nr:hypothetical protein [Ruficoccus amylovorans]MBC2593008.1 hypothetical protein [Ruficoccus amylovorans]